VHPQTWPDDLDYAGKNVVVIGSGATAATLIPAMVDDCNHITMLQRSPTYFATGRNINELVESLREIDIDEAWIHEIARRRILHDQHAFMELAATEPDMVKEELFAAIREYLGDDYDIEKHFGPSYRPWQQRVAFVPDGDLFQGIASGQASVVTDHIVRFNETGIELASGEQLDADIIVTATGFNLNVLGDIAFTIDGEPLAFHDSVTYRGTMFSGIPNMAWVFGYFRASWTLRADMIGDFVCRLLRHMDDKGAAMVTPMLREADSDMALLPWVDPENFNPGYLSRGLHLLPKQGDREPWQHKQMYWVEKDELPAADLDDGTLVYD
jgi:cation diffusion facilitator CzcD-associated flavoprotein CzcO